MWRKTLRFFNTQYKYIFLILISSCIKNSPQVEINYQDISDFNQEAFTNIKNDNLYKKTSEKLYSKYCISCHGYNALGGAGPNLVDKTWINGNGKVTDIYKTIRYGIPNKGMRSFEKTLTDKELISMALYINSLKE
jgi:mono/diheme cytochrome c family protein